MKDEIDRLLEDIPTVITKGFEEHKYILDCQYMPKLCNAQDKVRSLDSQLKEEVKVRDNTKEIKILQDQIDAYVKSSEQMRVKENDYKKLLEDYSTRLDEETNQAGELRTELKHLNKLNL